MAPLVRLRIADLILLINNEREKIAVLLITPTRRQLLLLVSGAMVDPSKRRLGGCWRLRVRTVLVLALLYRYVDADADDAFLVAATYGTNEYEPPPFLFA